jgi:hypothetical protein
MESACDALVFQVLSKSICCLLEEMAPDKTCNIWLTIR